MSIYAPDPGDLTPDEMYGREPLPVTLVKRERADCTLCGGDGCGDCFGSGKELTREDYLTMEAQVRCHECGTPFTPANDKDRLCNPCYAWDKT